jgi:hypothetical protein
MNKAPRFVAYALTIGMITALIGAVHIRGEVQGSVPAGEAFLLVTVHRDTGWELLSIDVATNTQLQSGRLPAEPAVVQPTPGGVSVFAGFYGTRYVTVFNTATLETEHQWETATGGAMEIAFSPDGSRLFIRTDTGYLETYENRRGELALLSVSPLIEEQIDDSPLTGGSIFTDPRGTRLFLPTPETVRIRFAGGEHTVDTINLTAEKWQTSADREVLWGVHRDRYPVSLSTRNGDATHFVEFPVAAIQPVSFRRDIWFLAASEEHLINPRGETIPAPPGVVFMAALENRGIWSATDSGRILALRGEGIWEPVFELETGEIGTIAVSHIMQEGTFACF